MHPHAEAETGLLDGMRQDYRASAMHGLAREASLHALTTAFAAAGVPLILLKGIYLARFVYRDPALRPMDDVDVLVHEEDAEHAEAILTGVGYRPAIKKLRPTHKLSSPALPYYRSKPHPEHVDLHWALQSMDYYRFPSAVMWKEAVETILGGYRVFFLSPEANFIHLGLHSLNHAHLLRNWLDLALIAKRYTLDWERCVDLSGRLGVTRAMHWVFQELGPQWRINPPSDVLARVASYRPRWIEDRVIRHRGRRYWRVYARLERLPTWRNKLDCVFSLIVDRMVSR